MTLLISLFCTDTVEGFAAGSVPMAAVHVQVLICKHATVLGKVNILILPRSLEVIKQNKAKDKTQRQDSLLSYKDSVNAYVLSVGKWRKYVSYTC